MPNKRFHPLQAAEPGAAGGASPAPAAEPETFSREYVTELRGENATYRTKAKEATTKAELAEAAARRASEEAESRIKEATTAANERIIRAELKAAAMKMGMVDLDGLKLADLTKVTLNEQGEVEGAETLMTEMRKAKPYLFGAAQRSSTPGAPPPAKAPLAKKATEMTAEEYAAARKSIK